MPGRDLDDLTRDACRTLLDASRKAPRDEQRQLAWLAARLREGWRIGMRFDSVQGLMRVDLVMPAPDGRWLLGSFGHGFNLSTALEEVRRTYKAGVGASYG